MTEVFNYPPIPSFLRVLTRGALKQSLAKAVRQWVILRSLYGDSSDAIALSLGETFSYDDWRKAFFKNAKHHHQRDKQPKKHSSDCPCDKSLSDWLFQDTAISIEEWKSSFQQLNPITDEELDQLLKTCCPDGRLFGVTGRNIRDNDFKELIEMKWLTVESGKNYTYKKVTKFPVISNLNIIDRQILDIIKQPDLAAIIHNYFEPIQGKRRFFLHADYVVSQEKADLVDEIINKLKDIWNNNLASVVEIVYDSASLYKEVKRIIHPVCIYYFQRAPYLCAFGEKPKNKDEIGWYNFRLDRIIELTQLSCDSKNVPEKLKQALKNKVPQPEYIEEEMSEAWGFDFYQESKLLLLRFNADFHESYIQDSFRHETFKHIPSIKEVKNLIESNVKNESEKQLLSQILTKHPKDAYYQAQYRVNDNNIVMRLRAWGHNVEILSPFELRDRMTKDIENTYKIYYS